MKPTWIYLASGKAAGLDATRDLCREGGVWVPGPRLPRPDPGVQPGDGLIVLWRPRATDPWGIVIGAGRIAPPTRKAWGKRPWLDTVPPDDPLFVASRRLGYGGPPNYQTMARLEAWTEDPTGIRRLAGPNWPGAAPGEKVSQQAGSPIVRRLEPDTTRLTGEGHVGDVPARIVCDPRILGGKPVIRGTRIAVEHVLGWLAQGAGPADILEDYPELSELDIRACLSFAERLLRNERIDPVPQA